MYKIYADDTLIYDSTVEDYKIGKGVVTLEVDKSGSFVFSVYKDHFFYDSFVKLKTVITVYKSGRIVFRGRILNDVTDYWNNKVITCEGELGFLQDSIIRPFSYTGSPEDLFKKFIEEHNSQVDNFKHFKVGEVTVVDTNGSIIRNSTDYSKTLGVLNSALTGSALGGHFYITHGEDGTDPIPTINYLANFSSVSSQTIEFGANLKNYTKAVKAEDMATAIIPFGTSTGSDNRRLTIEDVNDGLDYIYSKTGVELYGWIFKTVTWDDVVLASNLKEKAEEYLESVVNQNVTIELNAIDLHLLDRSIESFRVCDYVHVKSEPHNLDAVLLCNKQTLDLLKPENDTVVLGYQSPTFTGTNNDMAAAVSSQGTEISSIKQNFNNITLEVKNGETSSSIMLMSGETVISSGNIKLNGMVTFSGLADGTTTIDGECIKTGTIAAERLKLTGAITWDDLSNDMQSKINNAGGSDSVARSIAEGTYSGGTFIDGTSIYSPTIYSNDFNIYPKNKTTNGGLNLYGYFGSTLYHFLRLSYIEEDAPFITFSSPHGGYARWDFSRTIFKGRLDFNNATVTGLTTTAVFA